jgi:hypothetical protein
MPADGAPDLMATNHRVMKCGPSDVFRILADGWLYPGWVVGASRIRAVEPDWPNPGSNIRHSFGVWPLLIDDSTTVLDYRRPEHLELKARAWPSGEAYVVIDVRPAAQGCEVRIQEDAVAGPAAMVPWLVRNAGIYYRNRETLKRLEYLAVGRAAG